MSFFFSLTQPVSQPASQSVRQTPRTRSATKCHPSHFVCFFDYRVYVNIFPFSFASSGLLPLFTPRLPFYLGSLLPTRSDLWKAICALIQHGYRCSSNKNNDNKSRGGGSSSRFCGCIIIDSAARVSRSVHRRNNGARLVDAVIPSSKSCASLRNYANFSCWK